MICEFAHNDGAYVLGALAPAERADYEQHLAGCSACREAVASIAVLPGLLRRLAPLQTQEPLPSSIDRLPNLVQSLTIIRAKQRNRQRWQVFGSAAVAAGLVVAVTLGLMSLRPSPDTSPPVTMPSPSGPVMIPMTQVVLETAVTAEVALTETRGGVVVRMHCAYPLSSGHTKPYLFRLFAVGTDGMNEQLGSWMAAPGDDVIMSGMSRYDLGDLVRIELKTRDGTIVLAYDLA
jgi:hypothetical protein